MKTKVTIASSEVHVKTGTGRTSGKAFQVREQDAYLHEPGKPFPKSCSIELRDNAPPFPPGDYETEAHLVVNDFGRLEVSRDLGLARMAKA